MSGYQLGPVHYTDFGPFRKATFDFSVPGLTLIEAIIKGKRGCDSNGAGKSFLYDGPVWAIWGRCIRPNYTGDDIIRGEWNAKRKRNIPAPGTWASVEVELIGGKKPVRVERYRNHPKYANKLRLIVAGKDISRGTNDETQRVIENLIGMDFTTFCNSVAFGVREDVKSFFSAPDSERKRIMDMLLGLELYADAEKIARDRLKKNSEKTEELGRKKSRLEIKIDEKRLLLQNLNDSEIEDADFKIKVHRARLLRIDRASMSIRQTLHTLKVELNDEEESYQGALEKYEVQCRHREEKAADLDRKRRSLEREINTFEGEVRQLEAQIRRLAVMGGGECPTCGQPFSKKAAKESVEKLQEQVNMLNHKILTTDLEVGINEKLLEALDEPEKPENTEIDTLREEIQQERERRSAMESEIRVERARIEEMEEAQARVKAQIERLETEIKETQESLATVEDEFNALLQKSEDIEFWVEGFGAQGLRSFLIEAELPEINRWASVHAQRLLGAGTQVKMLPTTKLKKGSQREKISIDCLIPGCTNSYAGASVGQKKRLNLCLLMAFGRVVANRSIKPFRQFFADEIFDGLDKTGTESVAELLRDIANGDEQTEGRPVIFVTHNPRIKPAADRVITVYHNGEYAVLKGDGAPVKTPSKKKKVARRA